MKDVKISETFNYSYPSLIFVGEVRAHLRGAVFEKYLQGLF
jgi:hypothetical protein